MRKRKIVFALTAAVLLCAPVFAQQCSEHDLVYYEEEASCTEPGYACYVCSQCGHSEGYANIPALGHEFGAWTVVTQADCAQPGLERSECSRCAESRDREIPMPEHTFEQALVQPTCTKEGYVLRNCTVCGGSQKSDFTEPFGHSYEESLIQPTCKADGYTLLVCSVCSEREKTDIVQALGHDYQSTVTEPTCTAGGYTRHVCSRCEDAYRTDPAEKLGHEYGEGEETKEPTLTTMGRLTYTCVRCEASYTETTPKWTNPFLDLDKKAYYFNSVLWAYNKGITTGVDSQTFDPEGSCTRAQVVTFLWRQAGSPIPEQKSGTFSDVPADAYYADAVRWAVETGITNGVSAAEFAPDRVCTRCEVVTFLYRANGSGAAAQAGVFADVTPGDYYFDAVYWAYENGITTGTGSAAFSPSVNCTRGQTVTFLYRARTIKNSA